jgi:anaerobic selenocysteine-containing dehydrogenase
MAGRRDVPGIKPYDGPAGGWGALRATAKAVREQMEVTEAPLLLYRTNKPTGFDCPGCAWPDKEHTSTFQFCENGAKAVTWEATKKRVTNGVLLAAHTVSNLLEWTDYELENEGRLTHPMAYDDEAATPTSQSPGRKASLVLVELLRDMPRSHMRGVLHVGACIQ